jgi:hypothetical protein
MSRNATRHILDPETLAAMDAEFRSGGFEKLNAPEVPPLDPANDPFERNFDWLNEPPGDTAFVTAFASLKLKGVADWFAVAGRDLRKVALGGSLAGGTDEQVLGSWATQRFVASCRSAGAEGESVLEAINAADVTGASAVEGVSRFLQSRPEFVNFEPDQIVATALIVIHFLKTPNPG